MSVFKDGTLFSVHVSYWSGAKMLSADDLGLEESQLPDAFKLGRKYLVHPDVIRKFRKIESCARYAVDQNSFTFPIGNAQFVPQKRIPKVVAELKKCQETFNVLRGMFLEDYDKYCTEMEPTYLEAAEKAYHVKNDASMSKEEFVGRFMERIRRFYPSVKDLEGRFTLEWDVYEIAMPKLKETDGVKLAESEVNRQIAEDEYRKQTQQRISSFLDDVTKTLRSETLDICNRIVNNITQGKVITGKTVNSLNKFVERFRDLNFVGDQKVEDQLEEFRKNFLTQHSAEAIKDQPDLQEELKRQLNKLAEVAGDMTDISSVTGEYRRAIKTEW